MKTYFDHSSPLTICMWDFSWLMSGHPGGAYADLEGCVAGAVERGYNTLRVDVFPNLYGRGEHTFPGKATRPRVHSWGAVLTPDGHTVDVRREVIRLADLCRKHGLRLALDTWQSGAIIGEAGRAPLGREEEWTRRIADAWTSVIPAMRDDGVLERAAWLAPLNEVPLFLGQKLERVVVSDPEDRHEGMTKWKSDQPELDEIFMEINTWLGESIKPLIEKDNIPLAYSALGAENYARRTPDFYDLVDVHFMPDMLLRPEDAEALEKAGDGASKFTLHPKQNAFDLALFSAAWNRACQANYSRMLDLCHDYARNVMDNLTHASGKRFEAVVTEAYGPCNHPDHPEVDWTWYYRYNADAARIFSNYDFSGLTVSNHAEPLFTAWDNIEWQLRTNQYVLTAAHPRLGSV